MAAQPEAQPSSFWQVLEEQVLEEHPDVPRDQLLPWEAWERKHRKRSCDEATTSEPGAGSSGGGGSIAEPFWDALEASLRAEHPHLAREELLPWLKLPRQRRQPAAAAPSAAAPPPPDDTDNGGDSDYEAIGSEEDEAFVAGSSDSTRAGTQPRAAIVPLPDTSGNRWASRNKHKWQCQSTTTKTAPATNLFLADELDKLAAHYKAVGNDEWRYFAFSKQAKKLRDLTWEVTDAKQLLSVRSFGQKSVDKIAELLATGALRRLETMQSTDRAQALAELTKVHGVGCKIASDWYAKGITSVEAAVQSGLMTATQRVGARFYKDLQVRIPRAEVTAIVDAVRVALRATLGARGVPAHAIDGAGDATASGSYRRGKPSSGDVDVLLCRRDGGSDEGLIEQILEYMKAAGVSVHHLTHEEEVQRGRAQRSVRTATCSSYRGIIRLPGYELHRRLDLKLYPPEDFAYALLYFTGSDHFNRSMRHYAKTLGYSLSDHGIVHAVKMAGGKDNCVRGTKNLFEARTEQEIFEKLGLQYVEPSQRNTDVVPIGDAPRRLQ